MPVKIGLGGGCHWCTEAVFLHLKGVQKVAQGYLSSTPNHTSYSEGVIVEFLAHELPLEVLIYIHLLTHKSTSNHSRRDTYRSAIYCFSEIQQQEVTAVLKQLQSNFENPLITLVLPFGEFKESREQIQNYYFKNPDKPFCTRYIHPKIQLLQQQFGNFVK